MMGSTDDSLTLLDPWPSAVDIDDQTGSAVITLRQFRRQGAFPLMRLPKELRLHVISFLLPDVEEIDPGNEGASIQDADSDNMVSLWTTYRKDHARCEMAIMRTNREIYRETSSYLYGRLTVIVHVDDGVGFLKTHYGCGTLAHRSFNIPLQKVKRVWLQIHGSFDQARNLAHVRRNLKAFCVTLYQRDRLKSLRVDFWDSRHWRVGARKSVREKIITIQGGIPTTTIDAEDFVPRPEVFAKTFEQYLWGTGISTGCTMVGTDIELILQPLRLLRNVGDCQIFLNPHLQKDTRLVDMVAHCKELIESTRELTVEDLRLMHDTSEKLSRSGKCGICYLSNNDQESMDDLLWQTGKWHSMPHKDVEEYSVIFARWREAHEKLEEIE